MKKSIVEVIAELRKKGELDEEALRKLKKLKPRFFKVMFYLLFGLFILNILFSIIGFSHFGFSNFAFFFVFFILILIAHSRHVEESNNKSFLFSLGKETEGEIIEDLEYVKLRGQVIPAFFATYFFTSGSMEKIEKKEIFDKKSLKDMKLKKGNKVKVYFDPDNI